MVLIGDDKRAESMPMTYTGRVGDIPRGTYRSDSCVMVRGLCGAFVVYHDKEVGIFSLDEGTNLQWTQISEGTPKVTRLEVE